MSQSPATDRRHASVPGVYGSFRNRAIGRGRSAGAGKNSQRQRHSLLSSVRAGSGSDTVFVAPPQSPRFGVRRRVVGPLGYATERQVLARRGEDWRRGISSSAGVATAVLPARPDWGTPNCVRNTTLSHQPAARMGEVDDPDDAHLHRCCRWCYASRQPWTSEAISPQQATEPLDRSPHV